MIEIENMINMKWIDVQKAVKNNSVVLFPLGVIEEHGPHLCLGTDIYTAEVFCMNIKNELQKHNIYSIIAPPFFWGICQSTKGFIGSFTIKMETAKSLLLDILSSLHSFGFTEVYGVNAHGDIDQNILLMTSFKEAFETLGIKSRYCFRSEIQHFYGLSGNEPYICSIPSQEIEVSESKEKDIHAGDIETAMINKYYPLYVDIKKAKELRPVAIETEREMEWIMGGKTKEISELGYLGNPSNYENVRIEEHVKDIAKRYADAILMKRGT